MSTRTVHDRYSITDVDDAIFDEIIDNRIYDIHTAHPAKVIGFDGKKRTVDVILGVKRDMRGFSQPVSFLTELPICYPSSGDFGMTWPMRLNDTGLVVFCESSIDQWLADTTGEPVNPRNIRMHDYTDGIFIPNVLQDGRALSSDEIKDGEVVIKSKETKLTLKEDGTFCLETKHGEFLETLVKALGLINTSSGGVATAEIDTLLKMVCK